MVNPTSRKDGPKVHTRRLGASDQYFSSEYVSTLYSEVRAWCKDVSAVFQLWLVQPRFVSAAPQRHLSCVSAVAGSALFCFSFIVCENGNRLWFPPEYMPDFFECKITLKHIHDVKSEKKNT